MKLAILKSRNFRLLLFVRMCTMFALQAQDVIIGWQVYSLTKDVFLLGLAGLVEAVPAIVCALIAGHVVDNSHPKRIYVACLGALVFNLILLFSIGGGHIELASAHIVVLLFIGVFFSGLARGFISPCSFTLLSAIVPRHEMPSAAAWMSSGLQMAGVAGPAIAGIVFGGYGVSAAWGIPLFLMIMAFTMICLLKSPDLGERGTKREPAWQSITAGWKYILNNQALLSMMALDMFAVLFGGAVAIIPAFADEILHLGPEYVGALRAAPAIGSVAMGLLLAVMPMRYISAKRLLFVVIGFGICMIGFGLSPNFWVAAGFLFISGLFDSVSMVIRGTMMQLMTPADMKGRLSSINSMFIISSNQIGAFESGTAARLLGLVPSIIFGGFATLTVVGATAWKAPKFRNTVIDTHAQDN